MYNKIYIIENSRKIQKHLKNIQDLKFGDFRNAKHNLETKHSFNSKDSKLLIEIQNNQHRRIVPFNLISN